MAAFLISLHGLLSHQSKLNRNATKLLIFPYTRPSAFFGGVIHGDILFVTQAYNLSIIFAMDLSLDPQTSAMV